MRLSVYCTVLYNSETKRQSAEWTISGQKQPIKVRASKSRTKTMLITFFDNRGIIHREFFCQGFLKELGFFLYAFHNYKS